jgi:malic enzyme
MMIHRRFSIYHQKNTKKPKEGLECPVCGFIKALSLTFGGVILPDIYGPDSNKKGHELKSDTYIETSPFPNEW